MNIGAVSSSGEVSMRTTPSIGSVVPRWTAMSSSAGSDMGSVLLWCCDALFNNGFGGRLVQECRERRDFVGGTLDADHGRTVDGHRLFQCRGQGIDVGHVDRRQAREQARQTGPEPARLEPVVAVEVVVEEL